MGKFNEKTNQNNKSNYNKKGNNNNAKSGYVKTTRPPVKRTPLSSRKFIKDFDNFFDGIEGIKEVSVVYNLFKDFKRKTASEEMTKDDIMETILNIANTYLPLPDARKDCIWEYTIAANRVMVKTNEYVSFGWQTKRIEGKETNTFTMVIFGDDQNQKDIINNLLEDGWTEVENKRQ